MKKKVFVFTAFLSNAVFYLAAQKNETINMFRQTPEHIVAYNTPPGLYDEKDWSFFADAPIRSTPGWC